MQVCELASPLWKIHVQTGHLQTHHRLYIEMGKMGYWLTRVEVFERAQDANIAFGVAETAVLRHHH